MTTIKPFEDTVLNDAIFTSEGWHDALETGIEEAMLGLGIHYPAHVDFEDDYATMETISWDGCYSATNVDGTWDTLKEATLAVDNFPESINDNRLFCFDDSVLNSPEVDSIKNGRVFLVSGEMIRHSVTSRDLAIYKYATFLYKARHWLDNQDDLAAAYGFLDSHPVFWYRSNPERAPKYWRTHGAIGDMWQHVQKSNGKNVVMLEAGRSVPDSYTIHHHDHSLDVYAESFDEAYIQMAKKVHKKFYLNGESRTTE